MKSGSGSSTPPPPTISSIVISPTTASLTVNATDQLKANANYSDRTVGDVTADATWTSSDPSVLTVNKTGLITAVAPGSAKVTASDSGQSATAAISVTPPQRVMTSISVSPQNVNLSAGSTVQLKATAAFSDNTTSDVTSSASWNSSAPAVASVNGSGLLYAQSQGTTSITATVDPVSGGDPVTVRASKVTYGSVNVPTFHYDNRRSGLNNNETTLTPANVNATAFGKLFSLTVDGYVYSQPLYMAGMTIKGATHNVLVVTTEKNNVYAFDADNFSNNTPLWQTSLLNSGETPVAGGNPAPFHGSTSTPVVDTSTMTMYVVTQQSQGSGKSFRLNAIDLATGNVLKTAPVSAQVTPAQNSDSENGVLTMSQGCLQRSALLLDNGMLYFSFSACGSGWILAYDEATLAQKAVFAVGPNNDGNGEYKGDGGIWMGGSGPLSDGAGGIYVTTGNGPYNNSSLAYGDSILHFDSSLTLKDWFTPEDFGAMQCDDQDLSGGGAIMLPNGNIIAGGKSGKVFQVDSANLGQGPHTGNTFAVATLFPGDNVGMPSYSFSCTGSDTTNPPNGESYPTKTWNGTKTPYQLFGTPVSYNNSVYVGMTPGPVVQLAIDNTGKIALTNNATKEKIATSSFGTSPVISANGTSNAVLWLIDHGTPLQSGTPTKAVLRAYDPTNLSKELYDSNMSWTDYAGYGVKFSAPVVVNGKVYIATANDSNLANNSKGEIDVYGLK